MTDAPPPFSDPWLARRMHDRTAVHRAETELHPAVRIAVEDYLSQVRARLLGEQTPRLRFATGEEDRPDLQAFPDDSLWSRIVTGRIAPTIRTLFTRAFARFGQRERAVAPADDFTDTLPTQLAGFPRRVWERLRTAVTEGLARGETPAQLRQRVRELTTLEGWDGQLMTMTRTATMTALNAGAMSGALDEQARTGERWAKVWQCVPGDTTVSAFGATHAARRYYEGPLVRIRTGSGTAVALTPEHRVLTDRGWIRARDLHQGDHLFRVPDADAARTPHVQQPPPPIGQLIDALMNPGPHRLRPLQRGPEVDGETAYRHVEVVRADAGFTAYLQTCLLQENGQLRAVTADELAAMTVQESSSAASGPPHPSVDGDGQAGGCRLGTRGDASVPQDALHGGCGTAELPAHRTQRSTRPVAGDDRLLIDVTTAQRLQGVALRDTHPLLPVRALGEKETRVVSPGPRNPFLHEPAPDSRLTDPGIGGDLSGRLTSLVTPDHIVHIEQEPFAGHVYDLSTTGEWYTANYLVVHNSTSDERVRPSHHEADGQQRSLTEPFGVGGHRFQFPGDPLAPAQERINCRCSMRLGPEADPSLTASPTPQEAP